MRTLTLPWLFLLALLLGCSTPTASECETGRVLTDGFCTRLVCEAGQRVVDGACIAITCPDGATLDGETCAFEDEGAPSSTATPAGATYGGPVQVMILADEPAVIFYSTDGSTPDRASSSGPSPVTVTIDASADLQFFAVDAANNEESLNSESYVLDASGPDDITGLQAAIGPPDIDLQWTNPADLGGVLVVRGRAQPFGWLPQNGVAYAVGDVVAPGIVVVASSDIAALNDAKPWGDINTYAAWAFNDLNNYSANPATVEVVLPVPHQRVRLNIDLNTGTIDFEQPPDMRVSVAGGVSAGLDEVTLEFTYENLTPSPMYSIKAIFTAVSSGTLASATDYDGDPAVYFGANAILPSGTGSGSARIVGIPAGAGAITVDVALATHPLLLTPGQKFSAVLGLMDSSFATFSAQPDDGWFVPPSGSTNGALSMAITTAFSPDGISVYVTSHSKTEVKLFDLSTMSETMSSGSLGGAGTPPSGVSRLALSADGQSLYVAVTEGVHGGRTGCGSGRTCTVVNVVLVKLSAADLTEVGRVVLASNIPLNGAVGMTPAISPDGTRVAVPIDRLGRLVLVDAATMTTLWNIGTLNTRPRSAGITPDNTYVFLQSRDAEMTRVNVSSQTETPLPASGFDTSADGSLIWGPDGMLYVARNRAFANTAGIVRIDPDTLSVDTALLGTSVIGLSFQNGLMYVPDTNGQLRIFNLGATITQLDVRPFPFGPRGHFSLITPKPFWNPN